MRKLEEDNRFLNMQWDTIHQLYPGLRGKLSREPRAGSGEQGAGISMRRIKQNPMTVGVVTYYCGRNIFYFVYI
jgi:hypothetical protein